MNKKSYKVTCLKCKKTSRLGIIDNMKVVYTDHIPIIACRLRPDDKWGFECQCGNDNRLARQEKDQVDILVSGGGKQAIKKITDSLKIKDELQFRMEIA